MLHIVNLGGICNTYCSGNKKNALEITFPLHKTFHFKYHHKQYPANGPESPFTNTYAGQYLHATNQSGELYLFWLNVENNFDH